VLEGPDPDSGGKVNRVADGQSGTTI